MIETIIVVLGLCLFEVITSVDNAVINAHVLRTLPEKYRKFFLFWGLLLAVFVGGNDRFVCPGLHLFVD